MTTLRYYVDGVWQPLVAGSSGTNGTNGATGVVVSTNPPDITQIWADPNDQTYTNAIDGGSA